MINFKKTIDFSTQNFLKKIRKLNNLQRKQRNYMKSKNYYRFCKMISKKSKWKETD